MKIIDVKVGDSLKIKDEWFYVAAVVTRMANSGASHLIEWNLHSVRNKTSLPHWRGFSGNALEDDIEIHGLQALDEKYTLMK